MATLAFVLTANSTCMAMMCSMAMSLRAWKRAAICVGEYL